jgi:hypothetical protein
MKNLNRPPGPLAEIHQQIPGLLRGPLPRRMRGDAQDVHRTGLDLQHDQHVQALQQHRVHVQEITGKDAGRLGGQELPPSRRCPSRRRAEPGRGQDPADRPLPHPVPQANQLTLDPPVSPARILPRQLLDQRAHLIRDRRASRHARVGPFLLTRRRCQASSVHEDLHVRRGVAARQENQPAECPDHEQTDKAKEHET